MKRYQATCDCGWTKTYDTAARADFTLRRHVCPTTDGIRRTTRRHRCKRCGLEAVYENAGAKEARYWFNRHSCTKHEQAMLRAAYHQQRMALVDRTPQPCLHKQANHQHGTRACYVLDKCRCEPCARANSEAETWRERQKAYGRYHRYVNADLVREHVRALADAGMGLKTVAKRSGVSQGSLWKLMYGKRQPDGTQTPSRRVTRETADKLYALDPAWNGPLPLADGANIDGTTTRLRLRAMVALGYSISSLGRQLNIVNIHTLVHGTANGRPGDARVYLRTADKVTALYDDLSTRLPAETNQRERITASRARNYAHARGWSPPMILDNTHHDRQQSTDEPRWVKTSGGIWKAASPHPDNRQGATA
ncbi:MAG: hypothetical protein ACRDOJ_05115 [Nocardioidaceae bacterium]